MITLQFGTYKTALEVLPVFYYFLYYTTLQASIKQSVLIREPSESGPHEVYELMFVCVKVIHSSAELQQMK